MTLLCYNDKGYLIQEIAFTMEDGTEQLRVTGLLNQLQRYTIIFKYVDFTGLFLRLSRFLSVCGKLYLKAIIIDSMPISRLPVVSLPVSTKAELLAIATIMWAQGRGRNFALMQFLPEMASEPKHTIDYSYVIRRQKY